MRRHGFRPTALAAALAATFAVLAPLTATALPAVPADLGAGQRGIRLTLTVTESDVLLPIARGVTLRCRPTGGTHPVAADVCAALVVVNGEVYMAGTPHDVACPLHYRPVTVSARGTADGRRVEHRRTYPNECVLHSETGPLFKF